MSESTSVLDGLISQKNLAKELEKNPRTLDRWAELKIGPPRVRIGRTFYYDLEKAKVWCRTQGTTPLPSRRRRT